MGNWPQCPPGQRGSLPCHCFEAGDRGQGLAALLSSWLLLLLFDFFLPCLTFLPTQDGPVRAAPAPASHKCSCSSDRAVRSSLPQARTILFPAGAAARIVFSFCSVQKQSAGCPAWLRGSPAAVSCSQSCLTGPGAAAMSSSDSGEPCSLHRAWLSCRLVLSFLTDHVITYDHRKPRSSRFSAVTCGLLQSREERGTPAPP